jgi:hypothetical protein
LLVMMLGMILGALSLNISHQASSLYETALCCYRGERIQKYMEGVLAYSIAYYLSKKELQKLVEQGGSADLVCDLPYAPGVTAKVVYGSPGVVRPVRISLTIYESVKVVATWQFLYDKEGDRLL